jgi:hypothetical protein
VTSDSDDPTDLVREAIANLERDFARVAAVIDHATDPATAFVVVSEYSAVLRKLHDEAADLRARCANRVYSAEQMSLAVLADKIGVSKARADQLLKQAREKEQP